MKKQEKKIGFIFNHAFFLGGGEHSLFLLIESLKNSDYQPVAIVPDQGEISERLEKRGIPYTICPLGSLRRGTRKNFFRDIQTLRKALKDQNINIIHANGSRASLYGGIAGRLLGIPVVWHVRETIRDYLLYDGFLGVMANRIICVSQAVARKRFGYLGVLLHKKITVVHNGVDPDELRMDAAKRSDIRAKFGIAEDILISMIGNFVPIKGHEFLIKGISAACKRDPDIRLKFLCVGRIIDPDCHKRSINIAKEQGIEKRVVFLAYTTDVAGILSATDIYILPSQREGFSRSLLEAMGMGLPVIATKIPEIAEAIEDQTGGLLVNYGDTVAMANAILMLCRDANLRARMGKENREHVMKYFTTDIHRKAIENIYSVLLAR